MKPDVKVNLTTLLIAVALIVQLILLTAILFRVNQVYLRLAESNAVTTDIGLVANVSADDDPFIGPEDAPVTIVGFFDYSCGSCAQVQETLAQIQEAYSDQARVVFRDFPLGGPGTPSFNAALAAECADQQGKFWEMRDLLFANQPAFDRGSLRSYAASLGLDALTFDGCMGAAETAAEVEQDYADGQSYGVSSTPTCFVNGRRLVGTVSFSVFRRAVDEALP